MDQPPRRSRYFEVEAPARPLRKRPRPGETARLEALRSYLAARGVARAEDVLRWTVEVKRRAGGRSAGTLDAYFVDGAARYRSRADVARRAFGVETGAAEPPPPVARVEQVESTPRAPEPAAAVESTPRAPEPAAAALGRFEAAAAVRGNDALGAQAAAAEAVLAAVEAGSEDAGARGAALRALDGGLYRLHVNFSCRVRQRSDAVRRGRDVLTDLRRRCKALEKKVDPEGRRRATEAKARRRTRREKATERERETGRPRPPGWRSDDDASSLSSASEEDRNEGPGANLDAVREGDDAPATLDAMRRRCKTFTRTGDVQHLCPHLCYYREHEPARQLFELRRRVARAGGDASRLDAWRARVVLAPEAAYGFRVGFFEGEDARTAADALARGGVPDVPRPSFPQASHGGRGIRLTKPQLDALDLRAERDSLRAALWPPSDDAAHAPRGRASPHFLAADSGDFDGGVDRATRLSRAESFPCSPFGLLEEILWHNEWKLLAACVLLNVTTRRQVDAVLWRLFASFPGPAATAAAAEDPMKMERLEAILRPLGLHRKRARRLARMSREYLEAHARAAASRDDAAGGASPLDTHTVSALHGVGDYASDAHALFVLRRVRASSPPRDHALRWWHAWALDRGLATLHTPNCSPTKAARE